MPNMIAMAVSHVGDKFERVERPIPVLGSSELLIEVLSCGVCHSDSLTVEGAHTRHLVSTRAGARGDRHSHGHRQQSLRLASGRPCRSWLVWRFVRSLCPLSPGERLRVR